MSLSIIQASAESIFGLIVKNSFCYVALDKVRSQLQDVITAIALPRLGTFVAPIVGNQVGLMISVPVTLAIGEALSFTLKEMIYSIYDLALRFLCPSKRVSSSSFFLTVALQISSFTVGFFAKIYFCNYGMTAVSNALKIMMIYGAPVCHLPLPMGLAMPVFVTLATPTVTFIVGDIVSSIVQQNVYRGLKNISDFFV